MKNDVMNNMKIRNKELSTYACKDEDAIRFRHQKEDIRTPFYHDVDKIIYSLAYSRLSDKTQVFSVKKNDHISKRMTHVQYVSRIARTIGRALNLNEDLIEAASLGHDLGHTPYGHVGEKILNEISLKHNCGYFNHNIQSVRLLMFVENYGHGVNATMQVLDAIMCHNGEFLLNDYKPVKKTKDDFLNEYESSYKESYINSSMVPMTLEGCVLRISDMIAYVGRDVEDGIRMNLVTGNDIPDNIKSILGNTNSEIINTIINDIVKNSIGKNYIKLSQNIYNAMKELVEFNYKNIYNRVNDKEELELIKLKFNTLFNSYLKDLQNKNEDSVIYNKYYKNMSEVYIVNNSLERIVIDYIAGMTDDYFNKQFKKTIIK